MSAKDGLPTWDTGEIAIGPWTPDPNARPDEPPPHRRFGEGRAAIDVIWADRARTTPVAVNDWDGCYAVVRPATEPEDRLREHARQVHARHDLGHELGAWPRACALCEAFALPAPRVPA